MSMEKQKSFIRQTIAMFKGESDKALAEKNYRTARAAVAVQIAGLEAKLVNQEEKVALAEESVNKATYPTDRINDGEAYIRNIASAEEALELAKEELERIQVSMDKHRNRLKEFDKEVENFVSPAPKNEE